MSLSRATLSALQKAGAAVFAADVELKNSVKEYAERVNAAMGSNPFGLGNDTLFENWKVVARLSQRIAGIEEELKKVYQVASELTADEQTLLVQVPALAAPAGAGDQRVLNPNDLTPTDVLVKPKKKPSKPPARESKASPRLARRAGAADSRLALSGNAALLLRHLEKVLNATEFTAISQSAIGHEIGIPMGSMTAATKKLLESGRIVAGPTGSFKLANLK